MFNVKVMTLKPALNPASAAKLKERSAVTLRITHMKLLLTIMQLATMLITSKSSTVMTGAARMMNTIVKVNAFLMELNRTTVRQLPL